MQESTTFALEHSKKKKDGSLCDTWCATAISTVIDGNGVFFTRVYGSVKHRVCFACIQVGPETCETEMPPELG